MHTPGPWTVQPIGDETECNILGARRELIATVSDNDARLIAAAPELLEALELSLIEQERATLALGWLDTPGMKLARAAVAKAKGEANG